MEALDCRDNSCLFAVKISGMRTNGGCRCIRNLIPSLKGMESLKVERAIRLTIQAHCAKYKDVDPPAAEE